MECLGGVGYEIINGDGNSHYSLQGGGARRRKRFIEIIPCRGQVEECHRNGGCQGKNDLDVNLQGRADPTDPINAADNG